MLEIGETDARNMTADNEAPDGSPMFSPDGDLLAYGAQEIPGFYGDRVALMIHDLSKGRTREIHESWDRSVSGLVWTPDGEGFYGAIDDAGTRRVYFLPLDEGSPVQVTVDTDFDGLDIADDGTLVARNQSAVYPPRIVRIDPDTRKVERLDSFNDKLLAETDLGTYESVTYTGADGAEIQMWVHYPPGFDSRREYPLFLLIHGGPHGAVTDDFHFRWNAQTFASWGYVTAWPNFHGSSGFGQAFTDSINPDWATKPYGDVIAAAEWFSKQPWIDDDRMVAGGGSYGGYLSSILLGRDHPFKALVIHAAVYDLYAQTSADFAVHEERFGPYWQNPEIYRAISPHYFAADFDTPSLVIHGQNDLRVPVGQAFELFRALQMNGVESRLVYYPDENHWILTRENSIFWYDEVRDWIAKFAAPGPGE
jgi:dipeptidyl aminopeptidase/acylaminoacyl peptidase